MTATTTSTAPALPASGFRTFTIVWIGQFMSLIGTELSAFALGLWAYRETGSATSFTLILFSAQLPIVLLAPFAGALVDRWERRRTLIAANLAAATAVGVLGLLVATDRFSLWYIYPTIGLVAVANAFHWPAFATVPPLVVPRQHLGRAAGMVELATAVAKTVAPSLAAVLTGAVMLAGVLFTDLATFLFATATLLLVRIPSPARAGGGRGSLLSEVRAGARYLLERPGLVRLLLFFLATNLFVVFPLVLAVPLVASFASTAVVGLTASVGAAGLIAGSVVMSLWGGPDRKVLGVVGAGAVLGASSIVAGIRPSPVLIGAALFCFSFAVPVLNGCSQAIWQLKVAPELQGRVFALRRTVATATAPVGFLAAGPLADYVFEPLMRADGGLAGTAGALLGTGDGRGIGLMFVLFGLACVAVAAWGAVSPRPTRLDTELPDEAGVDRR